MNILEPSLYPHRSPTNDGCHNVKGVQDLRQEENVPNHRSSVNIFIPIPLIFAFFDLLFPLPALVCFSPSDYHQRNGYSRPDGKRNTLFQTVSWWHTLPVQNVPRDLPCARTRSCIKAQKRDSGRAYQDLSTLHQLLFSTLCPLTPPPTHHYTSQGHSPQLSPQVSPLP